MEKTRERELPTWLWLWPPFFIVAAQIGAKAIGRDFYRTWLRGEKGIVENLTVLFLVVAVVTAVAAFRQRRRVASRWFGPLMCICSLFCLSTSANHFQRGDQKAISPSPIVKADGIGPSVAKMI